MINEQELLGNIKEKSMSELKGISDEQYQKLLDATAQAIDLILETGDSIEVDDFGLFSRRKQGAMSASFFKTTGKLHDRINRKK